MVQIAGPYAPRFVLSNFQFIYIYIHIYIYIYIGKLTGATWSMGSKIQIEYIPNLNEYEFFLNV